MNDKQQLAAMGEELRLTEDQAKALSESMPQRCDMLELTEEPMCMAKRIEELEAQVRGMAGLLREATEWMEDHPAMPDSSRMRAALAGNLPEPAVPNIQCPAEWVAVAEAVIEDHVVTEWDYRWQEISGYRCGYCSLSDDTCDGVVNGEHDHDCAITKARAMLAAAPKPEPEP